MTWISRINAIQNPSKKVLRIPKTHNALVFIKSLYEVKDVVLSPFKSLCVTYLILGDEDQTIVTNYDEDNSIVKTHCQDPLWIEETAISIGGRFSGCQLFNCAISALKMYAGAELRLPDALKNLIISHQLIRKE